MKTVPSAKRITFIYFSLVAFAIIIIHSSVFRSTTETMEVLYAEHRLNALKHFTQENFNEMKDQIHSKGYILTQGVASFDPPIKAYFNLQNTPSYIPNADQLPYNAATEFEDNEQGKTYFVTKIKVSDENGEHDLLLSMDNSLYELSEESLFSSNLTQLLLTAILLVLSLLVVLAISSRLTHPVSDFVRLLSNKKSHDLSDVELPKGAKTKELVQLVESFNNYQQRIKSLMAREVSFNRYTSHELRSPLMVMKGALSLLKESKSEDFQTKQINRLQKTTNEMQDFIETLLSLTKEPNTQDIVERKIVHQEIEDIMQNHIHLKSSTDVTYEIKMHVEPNVKITQGAFQILLGNIVKNAFANTSKGHIIIEIDDEAFRVIDSGVGLDANTQNKDGFGLGLLLVNDICHRYHWTFEIKNNDKVGCTATLKYANFHDATNL